MKRQYVGVLAALLAAVLMAGCANQKTPAQQAIAAAQTALDAVRDEAQKYVPDQVQSVEEQLKALKESFSKGDYKSVLTGAPSLTSAINSLKDATETKKAEAESALARAKDAWGSMSTDVPKMVGAIEGRVAAIAKSHKLPKGVTKDAVAAAKSGLDALKSSWSEAASAAAAGDFTAAVAKGQAVKDKAGEIMKSLGMSAS
jgi:type II secretory pathway pseudopilin PulG